MCMEKHTARGTRFVLRARMYPSLAQMNQIDLKFGQSPILHVPLGRTVAFKAWSFPYPRSLRAFAETRGAPDGLAEAPLVPCIG